MIVINCNTCDKRCSEKRWTMCNCNIRNNFTTKQGRGIVLVILEFDYLAQVDFTDVRFIENTAKHNSNGHVSIQDSVGRGGMVFITFQKVYFGYGIPALEVATFADIFSVRQVELWKCTFEANTTLPRSINLHNFSTRINPATSAFRIIFRNVTFINTPIWVMRLCNVTFINSTFHDSSTYPSLKAISGEVRFQGDTVFQNNTSYNGGALALCGGSKMILKL